MYETLRARAPQHVTGFLQNLPRARATIVHRLLSAVWREDIGGIRVSSHLLDTTRPPDGTHPPALCSLLAQHHRGRWRICALGAAVRLAFPVRTEHAFDNIKPSEPVLCWRAGEVSALVAPQDLVELLAEHAPAAGWQSFAAELADAVVNLSLAYTRAAAQQQALRRVASQLAVPDTVGLAQRLADYPAASDVVVFFERLNTEGHNLHPCGRGRLGMRPTDLLRHDLESDTSTDLILVGVRRERVESAPDAGGRDVGDLLLAEYPQLTTAVREYFRTHRLDLAGYTFLPVHAWQLNQVVRPLFTREIAERTVVPVPAARLASVPTSSLRTLLTERSPAGQRLLVKTALDTLIGSTRRSISPHTTNNGPVYSRLLRQVIAREPALSPRIVVLDELAGASYRPRPGEPDPQRRCRALSALIRSDISACLHPGELPVPGCALPARSPVTDGTVLGELVARYAKECGESDLASAGVHFAEQYAALLLPMSVILMTKYGIAVEAHLQNCIFTFVHAVPTRLVLRDWGGMRIYPPRLQRQGLFLDPRPGALTITDDVQVMRAKAHYTVLSNHLGEVIAHLVTRCGVDSQAAWQRVRCVVEDLFATLEADPSLRADAAADRAALLAPALPVKAFVRMRLDPERGDQYASVRNPLHQAGW